MRGNMFQAWRERSIPLDLPVENRLLQVRVDQIKKEMMNELAQSRVDLMEIERSGIEEKRKKNLG